MERKGHLDSSFQRDRFMAIWSHELEQDIMEAGACGREGWFILWLIGKLKSQKKDPQVPVSLQRYYNPLQQDHLLEAKYTHTAACMGYHRF